MTKTKIIIISLFIVVIVAVVMGQGGQNLVEQIQPSPSIGAPIASNPLGISITIPRELRNDALNAFDSEFSGRTDFAGVELFTKEDWMKEQVIEYIKLVISRYGSNRGAQVEWTSLKDRFDMNPIK